MTLSLKPFLSSAVLFALSLGVGASAQAQADLPIYGDALENGWQNWSSASVNLASTAFAHSGATSISVAATPYSALALQHDAFDSTGYGNLTFWVNGGLVGGQMVRVSATLNHNGQPSGVTFGPLAANTWQLISVPLAALAADNTSTFTGFWVQEFGGVDQSANPFYVDDVVLAGSVPIVQQPPLNGGLTLEDDALGKGWQYYRFISKKWRPIAA